MSSSSPKQQQQQQQQRRRRTPAACNSHQSRNTNAYFDNEDYQRRSLINQQPYWTTDYYGINNDPYPHDYYPSYGSNASSFSRPAAKKQQSKSDKRYPRFPPSTHPHALYHENVPPRRRHLQQPVDKRDYPSRYPPANIPPSTDEMINLEPPSAINGEIKTMHSHSSSSTTSEHSNHPDMAHRKDLHTKHLAAAIAVRQQNQQQSQLGVVQQLMNSLTVQQQQPSSQTPSTVQMQSQWTNSLLATMIQQRLKEAALQAQAQQIQATLPTILAAQALIYQQQLAASQAQSVSPAPNVAYPGTKFNNRPLVKFPVARPTMPMPVIRPPFVAHLSRHRLASHASTTALPTYQQVQEIERGISLDEAIHAKNAIDIVARAETTDTLESLAIVDQ